MHAGEIQGNLRCLLEELKREGAGLAPEWLEALERAIKLYDVLTDAIARAETEEAPRGRQTDLFYRAPRT